MTALTRERPETRLVVNERSGDGQGVQACVEALSSRHDLDFSLDRIIAIDQLEAQMLREDLGPERLVLVAGGDGTIRTVAQQMAGTGAYLVPLPCGTMNMLARRLYGDRSIAEIIGQIAEARPCTVPTGSLNNHLFLLSAAIGFPATAATARERWRDDGLASLREVFRTSLAAFAELSNDLLSLSADGGPPCRGAAAIFSPIGIDALLEPEKGATLPVDQLDCALIHGAEGLEQLSFLASALAERWRDHPLVENHPCKRARVRGPRPLTAFVDGEPVDAGGRIDIALAADSLQVLSLGDAC